MRKIWVQDGRPRGMQYKSYSEYKRVKCYFRNIQQHANEQYIQEAYDDINNAAGCDLRIFCKMIKRQRLKNSVFGKTSFAVDSKILAKSL
jgi:hypothetical protein